MWPRRRRILSATKDQADPSCPTLWCCRRRPFCALVIFHKGVTNLSKELGSSTSQRYSSQALRPPRGTASPRVSVKAPCRDSCADCAPQGCDSEQNQPRTLFQPASLFLHLSTRGQPASLSLRRPKHLQSTSRSPIDFVLVCASQVISYSTKCTEDRTRAAKPPPVLRYHTVDLTVHDRTFSTRQILRNVRIPP